MMMPPLQAELRKLQLSEPFRIAHGTSEERLVLRLRCGEAVGEAPFVPYYHESPDDALRWIESHPWHGGPPPPKAPRAARLALDLLWHDMKGRQQGLSLSGMWRLDVSRLPPGCRSLGIPDDLSVFAERVCEVARQFPVIKLKLGTGNLDFDEAIIVHARQAAPHVILLADVNGGWSTADAVKMLPRMARHGIELVEQPVHHNSGVEGWRELRAALPSSCLPLYADESVQGEDDILRLSALVDGINIKLLKCGSLAAARAAIDRARSLHKKVMLGCMIEGSIGVTAAAHLAPLADWIDLDGHLYVTNDDYEGIMYDDHGTLLLPERPGIGVKRRKS